jgi:hypothetical protein
LKLFEGNFDLNLGTTNVLLNIGLCRGRDMRRVVLAHMRGRLTTNGALGMPRGFLSSVVTVKLAAVDIMGEY